MKTTWLALKRCIPVIFASALVLITFGCSETLTVDPIPQPGEAQLLSGNNITEQFSVGPEGGHIIAPGESVCLNFPEGAFTGPTKFWITSHPIHHLDQYGLKLMNRAVSLHIAGPDKGFARMVNIRMKYDFSSQMGAPVDEQNLTIYTVYGNYYRHPNICPIGECCVDCDCKSVMGCIGETGTFVVGEN